MNNIEWDYKRRVCYENNAVYINDDFGNLVAVKLIDVIVLFISLQD